MNSYYESCIAEIKRLMSEDKIQLAHEMICQELSMPYIPSDVLDLLDELKKDCLSSMDVPVKNVEIEKLISGNTYAKEKAVSVLEGMNLRLYHEEVQQLLLAEDLLDEFKGELIEALMEQRIDEPYQIIKEGFQITFVPSAILPSSEDETLQEAQVLFDQWFSNDNPSFYHFCMRLLEQETLETRPFDFTDIEADSLAKSIVRLVLNAFGQSDQFEAFVRIHKLQDIAETPLNIEKRGENNE
ncbi:MAG: DUF3196 family protein [Bacillota bacterium]|nr:DUF3196 family protein [Bacillota bacterium]